MPDSLMLFDVNNCVVPITHLLNKLQFKINSIIEPIKDLFLIKHTKKNILIFLYLQTDVEAHVNSKNCTASRFK